MTDYEGKENTLLRSDPENENETIRNYRDRIRQCEALGEHAMAEQIRRILVQEAVVRQESAHTPSKRLRTGGSVRPASLIFALTTAATLGGCARRADVAANERTIREQEKKWVQAVAAKDTMAIGNVYAEDGEFLPPGAPRVSGRAAVRSAWAALLKAPHLSLTFESSRVVVSSAGDLAVATGAYKLGMDGPKGQRIEDAGKFVEVWGRVNGEWKALGNIFNSDKAPT